MSRSAQHLIKISNALRCKFSATAGVFFLLLGIGISGSAQAVPSYSDQTGDACSVCHVGSFGPQLTAHGRQFKLTGYSDGTQQRKLPLLSGMLESSFTNTSKDQSGAAATGFNANNNFAFDQFSVFVAGRIYDNFGVFSQTTWDGIGHRWSWDNLDARFGKEVSLYGVDSILGVTLNNNPTVTDPYNTTTAWGFPYASSNLAPTPASTLIDGALAGRVVGMSAYSLIDDMIYVEGGAYGALPHLDRQQVFGVNPADGPLVDGLAPYWRVAYQDESPKSSLSVGTFGLAANVFPNGDQTNGTDNYLDTGFDASYQWHATKAHVFTLYGNAIHESAQLHSSVALGNAEQKNFTLNTYKLTGSYYFDQTYGLTLGGFSVNGSQDASLYAANADYGSLKNIPNSDGFIAQADWTPFGKEDSFGSPWANLRLSLQYVGYTRFNGGTYNYDGNGRNASDNNTVFLLGWFAF